MPSVSVIIPTFNRENFVVKAIDSVLRQTYEEYEIIVVDDGSTDNTNKRLKNYKHNLRYIYQENAGVSAARNTGIKNANGEWIAFLDSDDEWTVDYLATHVKRVSENPGICMQTTDCIFEGIDGKRKTYYEINGSNSAFNEEEYLHFIEPFCFVVKHGTWSVCSTIIHKEALAKAGLFDNLTDMEDFDLMARVALRGPFGMIREPLVHVYRRNETIECLSNQAKVNPIGVRENSERIFEKLKKIETLKYNERQVLNEIISSNRRAIGNLFMEKGEIKNARDSYKQALVVNPSIASMGRYILSYLPAKMNLWFIR